MRLTKKQGGIIAFALIAILIAVVVFFVIKKNDKVVLRIGEVEIRQSEYDTFTKQAAKMDYSTSEARQLLIDYIKEREAAKQLGITASDSYLKAKRKELAATYSPAANRAIEAVTYRLALQRAVSFTDTDAVEADVVALPVRTAEEQYYPSEEVAREELEAARKQLLEKESDAAVKELDKKYPTFGIIASGFYDTTGARRLDNGGYNGKPALARDEDVASYLAECKEASVCDIKKSAVQNVVFFMHIKDRVSKIGKEKVAALNTALKKTKVVRYDEK